MGTTLAKRRPVAASILGILLLAVLVGTATACVTVFAGDDGPQVTTNELDYAPEATVQISGSGFAANAEVTDA